MHSLHSFQRGMNFLRRRQSCWNLSRCDSVKHGAWPSVAAVPSSCIGDGSIPVPPATRKYVADASKKCKFGVLKIVWIFKTVFIIVLAYDFLCYTFKLLHWMMLSEVCVQECEVAFVLSECLSCLVPIVVFCFKRIFQNCTHELTKSKVLLWWKCIQMTSEILGDVFDFLHAFVMFYCEVCTFLIMIHAHIFCFDAN